MAIRDDILKEYSKAYTVHLAEKIGPNQEAFDELLEAFLHDEWRVTQRAAWIVSHCIDRHPWLIEKHIEAVLLNLKNDVNIAVKRNTVRILQFVDIPEDQMGLAAEICFDFLNSGKEAIAVKAHAMTILFNITKKFPELRDELQIAIEDQLPFGSEGIRSRGKKILKELSKL